MASLALLKNVNLKVISERLGHASIRVTADVYAHVAPSLQEAATEEIGSILYERSTEPSSKTNTSKETFQTQASKNIETSEAVN
jgi:hypothetical protein